MILPIVAIMTGLILLTYSAERFVTGAAATARYFGMSSLLVGMVIIGFGTSAPELLVSGISAYGGNPGLALGNAYGSNIANIGLILGITALISPIAVASVVLRRELPFLCLVTLISAFLIWDGVISRLDGWLLLLMFAIVMGWSIVRGMKQHKSDAPAQKHEIEYGIPLRRALFWLLIGLVLLALSARLLVWGAVEMAQFFGINDFVIGLTVAAVGTSLPELASSIMAAIKGEHDIAVGNVLGSNLFNTLPVVGIAAVIHPIDVSSRILSQDFLIMVAFTCAIFVLSFRLRKPSVINRIGGAILLVGYILYMSWVVVTAVS
jgi:cation:H+ antiporter